MRIHTNGNADTLREALKTAQKEGKVPAHVYFDRFSAHRSNSHLSAYEVHLGSDHKYPGDKRRRPNSGGGDPEFAPWAATYAEWGWFLTALFDRDPTAKVSGAYKDADDFHAKTRYAFA
jgi:hypothetical protein